MTSPILNTAIMENDFSCMGGFPQLAVSFGGSHNEGYSILRIGVPVSWETTIFLFVYLLTGSLSNLTRGPSD